ncbi:MAG: flagellar protein FliT [Myxococcales bacterium]|nr:flagellar protein FliT [Myxococcales bacterium]
MPAASEILVSLCDATRALELAAERGDLDAVARAMTERARCLAELGSVEAPQELVRQLLASDARTRAALQTQMRSLGEELSRVRDARSIADHFSAATPARFFNERI